MTSSKIRTAPYFVVRLRRLFKKRGSELIAVLPKNFFQIGAFMIRSCDCELRQSARNAGTVGQPERRHARTGLDKKALSMTVVAGLKLQNLGAAGRCARQPQGRKRGFRARVHQPDALDGGKSFTDSCCKLNFGGSGRAETRAGP